MSQVNDSLYIIPNNNSDNVRSQLLVDPISHSNETDNIQNNILRASSVPISYNGNINPSSTRTLNYQSNSIVSPMATLFNRPNILTMGINTIAGRTNSLPNTSRMGVNNNWFSRINGPGGEFRNNEGNNSTNNMLSNRYRLPNRQLSAPTSQNNQLINDQSDLLRIQEELTRFHSSLHSRLNNSPSFNNQQGSGTNFSTGQTRPNTTPNGNSPINNQALLNSATSNLARNNFIGFNNNIGVSPNSVNVNNYYTHNNQPIIINNAAYASNYYNHNSINNSQNFSARGSLNYSAPSVTRTSSRTSQPISYPGSSITSNGTSSRNSSPRINNYFHRSTGNTFAVSSNNTSYFFRNGSNTTNNTHVPSINQIMSIPTRSINLVEPVEIRLPPELIESFPVNSYTNNSNEVDDNSKTCSVCLEEYQEGEPIKRLPCTHFYHKTCIDIWLNKSTICPICKFDFIIMLQF